MPSIDRLACRCGRPRSPPPPDCPVTCRRPASSHWRWRRSQSARLSVTRIWFASLATWSCGSQRECLTRRGRRPASGWWQPPLPPQAVGGEPRSLDERLELGPHHSGVLALEQSPLGEAAVGAYYPTEDAYVFAIAGCRPSAPRDRRRWSARHSGRSPPPARTPSTAR